MCFIVGQVNKTYRQAAVLQHFGYIICIEILSLSKNISAYEVVQNKVILSNNNKNKPKTD